MNQSVRHWDLCAVIDGLTGACFAESHTSPDYGGTLALNLACSPGIPWIRFRSRRWLSPETQQSQLLNERSHALDRRSLTARLISSVSHISVPDIPLAVRPTSLLLRPSLLSRETPGLQSRFSYPLFGCHQPSVRLVCVNNVSS